MHVIQARNRNKTRGNPDDDLIKIFLKRYLPETAVEGAAPLAGGVGPGAAGGAVVGAACWGRPTSGRTTCSFILLTAR